MSNIEHTASDLERSQNEIKGLALKILADYSEVEVKLLNSALTFAQLISIFQTMEIEITDEDLFALAKKVSMDVCNVIAVHTIIRGYNV